MNEREIAGEIRATHGTLWHEWFHDALERNGIPFFHELKLDEYMPDGWSGTADWVFWHPKYRAFVLGDLKTARGEAMYWIERDGAKKEHIWQLSAYFYALLEMGLPMVKGFGIMYWPMNDTSDKEVILPSIQEADPIPKDKVLEVMSQRKEACDKYLASVDPEPFQKSTWLSDELAPPLEREQKLYWDSKYKVFNVKLVPHWLSKFCPYPDELCDCSDQGTTKVGHWEFTPEHLNDVADVWGYVPRKGYEEVQPTVEPSLREKERREKEL